MNAIERRKRDLEQYTPELTIGLEQVNAYWESALQACKDKPLRAAPPLNLYSLPLRSKSSLI